MNKKYLWFALRLMLNGSHVNAMARFLKLFSISLVISKKQALFPTFIILSVLVRDK